VDGPGRALCEAEFLGGLEAVPIRTTARTYLCAGAGPNPIGHLHLYHIVVQMHHDVNNTISKKIPTKLKQRLGNLS
jgi:hypothetical protein